MKIAIEAQRIFRKEKHGMDYVALETIRELQKIDQQNEYFILVSPGDDVCLQESANMHIVTVNWPSYPLWEQIGLPLALKKIGIKEQIDTITNSYNKWLYLFLNILFATCYHNNVYISFHFHMGMDHFFRVSYLLQRLLPLSYLVQNQLFE